MKIYNEEKSFMKNISKVCILTRNYWLCLIVSFFDVACAWSDIAASGKVAWI